MIENPTDEQLRFFRGIVYLIENKINNKKYIGESINRFSDRYSSCEWWKHTTNKCLKRAVVKYGLENFGIGAGKLFGSEEAELAQKHADKCYSSSLQLKNYLRNPW